MLTSGEIRRRLEEGSIHPDGIALASFLEHRGAREVAPDVGPAPSGVDALVAALGEVPFESDTFRRVAAARAAIAMARPALALARKRREHDHATGFHGAETWCVCPCGLCESALRTLCYHGLTPKEPRELQIQYHVAGVPLDPAYLGKLLAMAVKLLGKRGMRERVVDELLGWATRENDPVRQSVGTRTFYRLDPTGADPGVRELDSAKLPAVLRDQLAALATSLDKPSFASTPELPVTRGQRRDFLSNELGLLLVSDRLKKLLAGRIDSLDFTAARIRGKPAETVWLATSRRPVAALFEPCHGESPILDPNLVKDAPAICRMKEPKGWYLADSDLVSDLLEAGLKTGIHAHGALHGCPLKQSRPRARRAKSPPKGRRTRGR